MHKTILNLMYILSLLISNCSFAAAVIKPIELILDYGSINDEYRYIISNSRYQLAKDYEFIFFYSSNCAHCKSFAPILKEYSNNTGINTIGFIIGSDASNQGIYFPNSTVAGQEVLEHFFNSSDRRTELVVPALFIINKKNLHTYPVSRGALTYLELIQRMADLVPKILNNEAKMSHV